MKAKTQPIPSLNIAMEETQNPNSHERLRQEDTTNSWSEIPTDLLNLVFERLNFADFQRAKSVCSSWFSTSTTVTKNQIPLLILFPEDNHDNFCRFFNPEEKDRLYKTQDLGVGFVKSVCRATYGSWLLMQDSKYNLYILNLFTRERIELPSVESQLGMVKVERTIDDGFHIIQDERKSQYMSIRSPVFCIDEESKDYLVLWGLGGCCVVYAKKGDTSWNQNLNISDCCDMVYKDHTLYFLSNAGTFQILYFPRERDNKTFKQVHFCIDRYTTPFRPFRRRKVRNPWWVAKPKLVVTVTGKVLEVKRTWIPESRTWSFGVLKISSSGLLKKYKKVDCLGDEAMLLDLGITVPANENDQGFYRNSIYFSGSHYKNTSDIFLFNLETQKMELLHKFDCSSLQLSRARWFLPSFTHT